MKTGSVEGVLPFPEIPFLVYGCLNHRRPLHCVSVEQTSHNNDCQYQAYHSEPFLLVYPATSIPGSQPKCSSGFFTLEIVFARIDMPFVPVIEIVLAFILGHDITSPVFLFLFSHL
jgi:hypothetical protein